MLKIKIIVMLIIAISLVYLVFIKNKPKNCCANTATNKTMIQKKTMNLSWKDFQEQAEKTDTTIIDIRTQSEILEGKLFNDALEIDYYGLDFEQRISELSPNQTYLIYCRSGGRSGAALSIFEKYELNSYDLIDGYIGAK